jgi:hypothetical protein
MKRPGGQSCLFLLSDNLHFADVVIRIGAQRFFGCVLSIKKGRIFKPPRSLRRLTGFGENRVLGGFGAAPSLGCGAHHAPNKRVGQQDAREYKACGYSHHGR